jgi:hypothetical protein
MSNGSVVTTHVHENVPHVTYGLSKSAEALSLYAIPRNKLKGKTKRSCIGCSFIDGALSI